MGSPFLDADDARLPEEHVGRWALIYKTLGELGHAKTETGLLAALLELKSLLRNERERNGTTVTVLGGGR